MKREIIGLQKYLKRFNYLDGFYKKGEADNKTLEALRNFKAVYLPESENNDIDTATASLLRQHRCGVPDHFPKGSFKLFLESRFVPIGCSYFAQRRNLGYAFDNFTTDMSNTACKQAIERAFQSWSAVIPMHFYENNLTPDIRIGFYAGAHADNSEFDGVGGVLAHAYYPPPCGSVYAGNMHFDEDELWKSNGADYDLESVALHEIGHLLGLAHSSVQQSVMYAYYGGMRRTLTNDDILGMQSLYGKAGGPPLSVMAHLQDYGNISRIDNEFVGTRYQAMRLEGFNVTMPVPNPDLIIEYMAHLETTGDTGWVEQGNFIGTQGQGKRLEGFAMRLKGTDANRYNIFYMAHLEGHGDTGLYSNGDFCGTRGEARRVEGILVRIEPK